MHSFFIETWGCQMNRHDSERLHGHLLQLGLAPAAAAEIADLVLLNTCSVREKPAQKVHRRIEDLARSAPQATVGVCGCVAQQEGEALLAKAPNVGFVLGPGRIPDLGSALDSLRRGCRSCTLDFETIDAEDAHTMKRASSHRAMVTVIEGCDERCTFCIVPTTRGHESSRPLPVVLDEVRRLVHDGVVEVELLGQTINNYRCPQTGVRFAELLERTAMVPGLRRLSFVTSHPGRFDGVTVEAIARHSNISRYLHLPCQAGADRTLRRMNRKYTRDQYLELVEQVRAAVPEINLSTDVIVGFPGETEAEFEATLDLLDTVRFGQVFAFVYSPRSGTPAARLPDPVPPDVASKRIQKLFRLTDAISLELNEALIGREVEVLVDGESKRSSDDWQGRGPDNRVVNFPKPEGVQPGCFVNVKIERAGAHSLRGRAVSTEVSTTIEGRPHSISTQDHPSVTAPGEAQS